MNKKLKIIAFGDSLTAGNAIGGEFENWTEIIAREHNVDVVNAGVGGDTTYLAMQRFCKDVLGKKPDIVFINFGMNDHLLSKEGRRYTQISDFEKNICCFIDELEKIGARAVLVTPNYFLEGNESEYYYSRHNEKDYEKYGGALALFDEYTEKLREIARYKNVALVDIRKECEKYNPYDFLRTAENCNANDGVHPGRVGVRAYADLLGEYIEKIYIKK
ncbi:MAG: hypothetical protein E7583_00415 [Ruminococcaceae bacterium]|nr:hypothetical protein [Oscillospiraceae bacterium]